MYGGLIKGHQGQGQGQHGPWPLWSACNSRPLEDDENFMERAEIKVYVGKLIENEEEIRR